MLYTIIKHTQADHTKGSSLRGLFLEGTTIPPHLAETAEGLHLLDQPNAAQAAKQLAQGVCFVLGDAELRHLIEAAGYSLYRVTEL